MNIFIPAAGFGTRLLPITANLPKPLIPILGKPLLGLLLEKTNDINPQHIGINLHYQQQILTQWLNHSPLSSKIQLFPEDPILDSGGALKNAQSLLLQDNFIVYNSDVLCDIDLKWLLEQHEMSKNLVTLTTCKKPLLNHVLVNVAVNEQGIFQGVDNKLIPQASVQCRVAYTGIAVYSPDFLQFLPSGKSSVLNAWLSAANAGHSIGTVDISHYYWNDIGTPAAYFSAVMQSLKLDGKKSFIHPSATVGCLVEMEGAVVIEAGCIIDSKVSLKNCLILPGAELKKNPYFENCIVGPGYVYKLSS